MNKHYLATILFLACPFASCVNKDTIELVPFRQVMVKTTVAGQMTYGLFSLPAAGITVYAHSTKLASGSTGHSPTYYYFILDSTVTDANGNYSMSFEKDSFECAYHLTTSAEAKPDSPLVFSAGGSTWRHTLLLKTVKLKVFIDIRNNYAKPFFSIYRHATDTVAIGGSMGDGIHTEELTYDKDSVAYLYFVYEDSTARHVLGDTFSITSYTDTAARHIIVDRATF